MAGVETLYRFVIGFYFVRMNGTLQTHVSVVDTFHVGQLMGKL